jgi:ankyrin repeat protein
MFWAAGYGYTEVVRELIKAGARVGDPIDQFRTTPLMHAVRNGKPETVQALLELGAQITAEDTSGKTALAHAKAEGKNEIVDILLKAGGKE